MNWPKRCNDCKAVVYTPADARAHVCRTEAPTEPAAPKGYSNDSHYMPERRDEKCDTGCGRPRVLVIKDLDLGFCLKHEEVYDAFCTWWIKTYQLASK